MPATRRIEDIELLGVRSISYLDHDDYEGANVICALNAPVPEPLVDLLDLIVDGSVLDNVFSPAAALQNIARMLNAGGA